MTQTSGKKQWLVASVVVVTALLVSLTISIGGIRSEKLAPLAIVELQQPQGTIPQYSKYELEFSLNRQFDNPYDPDEIDIVGSSRVDLQACKLEYSIVSPK